MISAHINTIIDLGTGDGRFVYKSALKNPQTFYIGIDPSQKQLEKYQTKINKHKLTNAKLLVGSVENLPKDLENQANEVHIILPWGTLLQHITQPNVEILKQIRDLLKPKGALIIIFGYAKESEPSETERLELEKLNEEYIRHTLIPAYEGIGLVPEEVRALEKKDLKGFETTWCKKLAFGKPRPMFFLRFRLTSS